MAKYSVNADRKRGKKLEKSLEKLFPDKSWRARSLLLEIPDSTVVGWRNGREISCSGLSRLFDVGCDITYILTGKEDAEHKITHALRFMQPEEVENAELKQKNFPPAEASGERDVGNDLLGELRGESNFNQKRYSVLIDKEVAGDVPYNQKGDMNDSDGVEFLKDHLSTLKQDKADLLARVAFLEKELAGLREENKRLLTLSSAKDTRQAGSG